MDLAQTLLKMVTRAFYDTRQIIAVDAVMTHSWFVPGCLAPVQVSSYCLRWLNNDPAL